MLMLAAPLCPCCAEYMARLKLREMLMPAVVSQLDQDDGQGDGKARRARKVSAPRRQCGSLRSAAEPSAPQRPAFRCTEPASSAGRACQASSRRGIPAAAGRLLPGRARRRSSRGRCRGLCSRARCLRRASAWQRPRSRRRSKPGASDRCRCGLPHAPFLGPWRCLGTLGGWGSCLPGLRPRVEAALSSACAGVRSFCSRITPAPPCACIRPPLRPACGLTCPPPAAHRRSSCQLEELEAEERLAFACEKAPTTDPVIEKVRPAVHRACFARQPYAPACFAQQPALDGSSALSAGRPSCSCPAREFCTLVAAWPGGAVAWNLPPLGRVAC
jgi:hypothetical protein